MSINFIVIDLSKPRKIIMNKIDDVIFDYKMTDHKPLTVGQKAMIVAGVVIAATILMPDVAVYAKELVSNLSDKEVVDLFRQHMEKLHYSKELIERNLTNFDTNTMRRILDECSQIQQAVGEGTPLLDFIETMHKGATVLDKAFESGVEHVAHVTRNINPFVRIFEGMR